MKKKIIIEPDLASLCVMEVECHVGSILGESSTSQTNCQANGILCLGLCNVSVLFHLLVDLSNRLWEAGLEFLYQLGCLNHLFFWKTFVFEE